MVGGEKLDMRGLKYRIRSMGRTANFGAIEYCINDRRNRTLLQLILQPVPQFLSTISERLSHYLVDTAFRDHRGSIMKSAQLRFPATQACILLDSHALVGPENEFQGSIEYRVHPVNERGVDVAEKCESCPPYGYVIWTDEDKTLTSTHVNHTTVELLPLAHWIRQVAPLGGHNRLKAPPAAVALHWSRRFRSSFFLQNRRYRLRNVAFEIRNSRGEARFATIPDVGPYEAREVFISDYFADLDQFVDHDVVQVILHGFPWDITNLRFLVKTYDLQTGAFSIDHSYHVSKEGLMADHGEFGPERWGQLGKGYFFPHTIEQSADRQTRLVLYNCDYEDVAKEFGLTIYRSDGSKVFERRRHATLPPRGFVVIDFGELVPAGEFLGHFEVYWTGSPNTGVGTVTPLIHGQVIYSHANGLESNQVGSAFWAYRRGKVSHLPARTGSSKYCIMPFINNRRFRSELHLTNASAIDGAAERARYRIKVIGENGDSLAGSEIELDPDESGVVDETAFKNLPPELGNAIMLVEPAVDDWGEAPLHFSIVNRATGSLASDHVIGVHA